MIYADILNTACVASALTVVPAAGRLLEAPANQLAWSIPGQDTAFWHQSKHNVTLCLNRLLVVVKHATHLQKVRIKGYLAKHVFDVQLLATRKSSQILLQHVCAAQPLLLHRTTCIFVLAVAGSATPSLQANLLTGAFTTAAPSRVTSHTVLCSRQAPASA